MINNESIVMSSLNKFSNRMLQAVSYPRCGNVYYFWGTNNDNNRGKGQF